MARYLQPSSPADGSTPCRPEDVRASELPGVALAIATAARPRLPHFLERDRENYAAADNRRYW